MDIDQLRTFCTALPAVTEDVKWGDNLVFSVGNKMFCMASLEPPFRCSFKVPDEEFEELSSRDGFLPSPYMARAKWVLLTSPTRLHNREWEAHIRRSYELVKARLTKKARTELGLR